MKMAVNEYHRHLAARVNALLLEAGEHGRRLTHLELQKMLYLNYVVHLRDGGDFLPYLNFEAWKYGPVVPDVYYHYKDIGSRRSNVIEHKMKSGRAYPALQDDDTIEKTIATYSRYDAYQLVGLTHEWGGAWFQAFAKGAGTIIEHKDIKKEFCYGGRS